MIVYLVRHGEADVNKNLSPDGRIEVEIIARFLKPLKIRVEAILHSGKARARETAEILSSTVESNKGVVENDGLKPNDPVKEIALNIHRFKGDIMIVGHLPFLNKLASYLLTGNAETVSFEFPNAGIICLKTQENGRWTVKWVIPPEILSRQ